MNDCERIWMDELCERKEGREERKTLKKKRGLSQWSVVRSRDERYLPRRRRVWCNVFEI